MNFGQYQRAAMQTAVYPPRHNIYYPALALAGEAGEVAGKVSKCMRGDASLAERREQIGREIGGVLWYCAALASDLGMSLEHIASENIKILADREKRGVIKGNGDTR